MLWQESNIFAFLYVISKHRGVQVIQDNEHNTYVTFYLILPWGVLRGASQLMEGEGGRLFQMSSLPIRGPLTWLL